MAQAAAATAVSGGDPVFRTALPSQGQRRVPPAAVQSFSLSLVLRV